MKKIKLILIELGIFNLIITLLSPILPNYVLPQIVIEHFFYCLLFDLIYLLTIFVFTFKDELKDIALYYIYNLKKK
jgi:hypothetical protein